MAKINNERGLPLGRLRNLLSYNSATGVFCWRMTKSPRAVEGSVAGCVRKRGYRMILVDGQQYKASRLAWFYFYGAWPEKYIDHINGIKDDDRISNLREASISENAWNVAGRSSTGIRGVYKAKKRFQVSVMKDGKMHYLGHFKTLEEATQVRREAALRLHGDFAFERRL